MDITPVILCGGSGSRLWPQSRTACPKAFLSLVNGQTFFQNTLIRLEGIENLTAPLVVANETCRFLVAEQFRQAGKQPLGIILEPVGRNTAPAVTLAALTALKDQEDPLLLVLPVDHVVNNVSAFHRAVEAGTKAASEGKLILLGVVPSRIETEYGYIRVDHAQCSGSKDRVFCVSEFVEKPDSITAKAYLDSGGYYWNSGMFIFRASSYVRELKRYQPAMLAICQQALNTAQQTSDFTRVNDSAFKRLPNLSIDVAVIEKTAETALVPLDAGWSDVGTWSSLAIIAEKDKKGNTTSGDVLLYDTQNTYVRSEKKLIATVGIENLVISESDDAILIAAKDKVQNVKKVVEHLKASGRKEAMFHRHVLHCWGGYNALDEGTEFQISRITVRPGEKLSLQKDFHRARHWIVMVGTAQVTRAEEKICLTENQSIYIPTGVVHTLENPQKYDLELIEVQTGGLS